VVVEDQPSSPLSLTVASPVVKDQKWPVTYDPKAPAATLTTAIITPSTRMGIEAVLGVALLVVAAVFALNLAWRKNKSWQNISGVMQGADIASSVLRNVWH
jgi:hypothetical protein